MKVLNFLRRPRIIAQITASSYFILFSPNQVSYYFSSSIFSVVVPVWHTIYVEFSGFESWARGVGGSAYLIDH